MNDEIIRTENLHKSFGKLEVLKGISTTICRGEVVSIIGPSGGGKSTFLRCLNLLEEPTGGKVFFEGQDITAQKKSIAAFRQKIGMVFQNYNTFPHLTVLNNITIAPRLEKKISRVDAEKGYGAAAPGGPGGKMECVFPPIIRRAEAAPFHRARAGYASGSDAV